MTIKLIIKQLRAEHQKAAAQVERLTQAIEVLNGVEEPKTRNRKGRFSAGTKAKMARAQRARRRRERKAQ